MLAATETTPLTQPRTAVAHWLGTIRYQQAWQLQREVFDAVLKGERPNTILFCEHPDVLTIGKNARDDRNLLAPRQELGQRGYEVFDVDRGGDVTYHGPGQLVGYPIVRLGDFREDLGWYMRGLEEVIIKAIGDFGIAGGRIEKLTGVWCGDRKICAIGVRASRWTTMHGFALNVSTNLERFGAIVPCGIADHPVTSMLAETGQAHTLLEVANRFSAHWDGVMAA
ncbi:MAG: lipoyl(octanoyl) transferase LipB [Chlorobi bacterium CHB2]|nr:lipoyl(octanoyl) transferase LipB [Chlorobi bacterium CHB2]